MRIADILRTIADKLDQDTGDSSDSQIQNPAELIDVEPAGTNISGPDVNNKSVVPSDEPSTEEQDIVSLIKQLANSR